MRNRRQLAEVIIGRLNGGVLNRDSKITIRDAMFALDQARDEAIKVNFNMNYKEFGDWDVVFEILSEHVVTSKYNETKKIWYVDLPSTVIDLYEGRGVYHVSRIGEESNDFIPMKSGDISLFSGLEASAREGKKGYVPRGTILELHGVSDEDSILLRLIVTSENLEDWADYELPGSLGKTVVEAAIVSLGGQAQIPADENNDNIQLNTK